MVAYTVEVALSVCTLRSYHPRKAFNLEHFCCPRLPGMCQLLFAGGCDQQRRPGAQVVDHFIGGQDEAESSESDSSEDDRAVPRYWGRARGLSAGMTSPHCAF